MKCYLHLLQPFSLTLLSLACACSNASEKRDLRTPADEVAERLKNSESDPKDVLKGVVPDQASGTGDTDGDSGQAKKAALVAVTVSADIPSIAAVANLDANVCVFLSLDGRSWRYDRSANTILPQKPLGTVASGMSRLSIDERHYWEFDKDKLIYGAPASEAADAPVARATMSLATVTAGSPVKAIGAGLHYVLLLSGTNIIEVSDSSQNFSVSVVKWPDSFGAPLASGTIPGSQGIWVGSANGTYILSTGEHPAWVSQKRIWGDPPAGEKVTALGGWLEKAGSEWGNFLVVTDKATYTAKSVDSPKEIAP